MGVALWVRRTKNRVVRTGPLAYLFAFAVHSIACSALLALLVRSAALICSLMCPLTHYRARGKVDDSISQH